MIQVLAAAEERRLGARGDKLEKGLAVLWLRRLQRSVRRRAETGEEITRHVLLGPSALYSGRQRPHASNNRVRLPTPLGGCSPARCSLGVAAGP